MKTNEEKLKQLLIIAVDNGWKDHKHLLSAWTSSYKDELWVDPKECELEWVQPGGYDPKCIVKSLNDLVSNWEPNEVSFIEALFIELSTKNIKDFVETPQKYTKSFRFVWEDTPTSQRLELLFKTFQHLL